MCECHAPKIVRHFKSKKLLQRTKIFNGKIFGKRLNQVLNMSVLWIPGYPGPPAPGPRHRPIFRINDPSYGEDPHEEAPREENDDTNG
jgi:hypothetical protein